VANAGRNPSICDFVDGGTCQTEEYRMEKFDRPKAMVKFAFSNEKDMEEFGKIEKIECTLLGPGQFARTVSVYLADNAGFGGSVCPEDKYTLISHDKKEVILFNMA
jgi:hypothetical protein